MPGEPQARAVDLPPPPEPKSLPCPWPLGAGWVWVETFVSTQRRRQTFEFASLCKERKKKGVRQNALAPCQRVPPILEPLRHPAPLQVPRGRTQERTTATHTSLVVGGPLGALSGAQRGRRLPSVARLSSADTARLAVCDPGPGVLAPLSWGSALAISPLPFPARRTSSAHRGCKPAREREARPPTTQSVRRKASPPVPPLSRTGRARRWVGAELLAAVRRARREELAARRLWRQVSAEAPDEAAVRVVRDEQPPTLGLWASISSVHPGRGRRPRGFVTARRHCGSRPTPPSRTPREGTRVAR